MNVAFSNSTANVEFPQESHSTMRAGWYLCPRKLEMGTTRAYKIRQMGKCGVESRENSWYCRLVSDQGYSCRHNVVSLVFPRTILGWRWEALTGAVSQDAALFRGR